MPERFEIYIVYKRRYINTLPFLSFPFLTVLSNHVQTHLLILYGIVDFLCLLTYLLTYFE